MTLKQQVAINNLPKNNYNVSKSLRAAGYTRQSAYAGTTHKSLRNLTNKIDAFNPDKIKARVISTYKLAEKKEDITNMNRNLEHQAKIAGIIVERSEVDNKNPDKVIITYGNKTQPIDTQVDKDSIPS